MKYRFYTLDEQLNKHTVATRSSNNPVSVIARTLRDLAWKRYGQEGYIVHDNSVIGGYYRNDAGDTISVELDFDH